MKEDDHVIISRDGNSHTLTLKNVLKSDKGHYKCEFTNEHGSTGSQTDLSVNPQPEIQQAMKDKTCEVGDENVEFTVKADTADGSTIKW